MKEASMSMVEKILGVKLFLLSFIILSITLAQPAAIVAHQGAQKVCSFLMKSDCSKHC